MLYYYQGDGIMKYENLYRLRKEHKYSLQQLGNLLGTSHTSYRNLEEGISEPTAKKLIKLADFYNVSIDYIADYTPKGQIVLPPLNEAQINVIKTMIQLNTENQYNMLGYASALTKTK